MILGFFPKKAAFPALFPAFPARSRPGSSLEMCGFPPAEKVPSKGNVGGTPVQPQYRGTACPLPSLPENGGDFGENKVRQRTGAVAVRPPCAGDFVKSRALGRNGTRDSTGVRRAPSPLSLKTEEISARTRPGKEPGQWQYALPAREISSKAALWGGMGPVTVPGYGAGPIPKPERWILAKDQALP